MLEELVIKFNELWECMFWEVIVYDYICLMIVWFINIFFRYKLNNKIYVYKIFLKIYFKSLLI